MLSIIIIFVRNHSFISTASLSVSVVNCFQLSLSLWGITALNQLQKGIILLWIAFNYHYLCEESQLGWTKSEAKQCCELLSIIIIFVRNHSVCATYWSFLGVVNCFQLSLSLWGITATTTGSSTGRWLWIAFNYHYLCEESQQTPPPSARIECCELLSIIIIFVRNHSTPLYDMHHSDVVNCFQLSLSLWGITARYHSLLAHLELWIAFNYHYLCEESQPSSFSFKIIDSCELLSIIIIFVRNHSTP